MWHTHAFTDIHSSPTLTIEGIYYNVSVIYDIPNPLNRANMKRIDSNNIIIVSSIFL